MDYSGTGRVIRLRVVATTTSCACGLGMGVTTSASTAPPFELMDHQAVVKALAWSPHEQNLLARGGGTADWTIKFWNSRMGALLNSIDTESQVCALQWNLH